MSASTGATETAISPSACQNAIAVLAETALVDFLHELLEDAGSFPAR